MTPTFPASARPRTRLLLYSTAMNRLSPYPFRSLHRKVAPRLLPIVRCTIMSTSRFVYEPITGVERLEYYQPGGYHPVQIGDYLHNRYRIVHKLGHGPSSTTWLARDRQLSSYAAVRVGTSNPHQHEMDVLSRITDPAPEDKGREKPLLPAVIEDFSLHGPNGTHRCLVTNPTRCSLTDTKDASSSCLFQLQVARALAAQLAIAVARIHDLGYVHGGKLLSQPLKIIF